jgi:hypothetical protein
MNNDAKKEVDKTNSLLANFLRGIFFGMGTFVGGTIVVALVIWLLSVFVDVPGGVGDFVQAVLDTLKKH